MGDKILECLFGNELNESLISVIIPVYNGEKYIAGCYRCLNDQTYKNLEIIFINDGSKDNTKNLLDDLAMKDSRIVVIHKENGGVSRARNTGLDVAKGEYICFLDVDDYLDTKFFEILLNDALKYEADVTICQNSWSEGDNNSEHHLYGDLNSFYGRLFVNSDEIFKYYFANSACEYLPAFRNVWGRLFKRSITKNLKFNEGFDYNEDGLFMFEIFARGGVKIYFDIYCGYNYIRRNDSALGTVSQNFFKSCKGGADAAKFELEVYKLALSCCNEDTIGLVKNKTMEDIHISIYRLIRNNERTYLKNNNGLYKHLIKDSLKNKSFAVKIYLRSYLYFKPFCWLLSKAMKTLQKHKYVIKK